MRSRRPFEWKPTLVYGVAAALFAMTLSYFLWSWMGVPNPPVIRDALWYLLIMAVLIALSRYPMIALSLFFLAVAWLWITWPETVINEDSTFLWKWIQDVYDAFFWGLTLNPFKGAMPLSFVPVLRIVTSFLSFVFLYAIPFPAMALTLLAGPLFFMPELGIHPHWLIWLFMGLGCITISFYRPTDTSRRKLPHPGIVAGLWQPSFCYSPSYRRVFSLIRSFPHGSMIVRLAPTRTKTESLHWMRPVSILNRGGLAAPSY